MGSHAGIGRVGLLLQLFGCQVRPVMKFSIVITTHNRLKFLRRAVESALAQSVPCEVVIADNASVDGTAAYAASLEERVIYHRNHTNLHHAGAVNAGVAVATGDWIKFLDDDDFLAPDCIEQMARAIHQHPQAVICSGQAIQVDQHGKELSRTVRSGPGQAFYVPQAAIHYGMVLELLPFGTPVQVAVRRDALIRSGGWDLSMTSCDDIDSWIRVAQYGDALFINSCIGYRTLWSGGYDHKIDFRQRLSTNLLIKTRSYQHVSEPYRSQLPCLEVMEHYLHLHWGLVALKQRQIPTAIQLALPGLACFQAWRMLWQARTLRSQPDRIPKIALVPG